MLFRNVEEASLWAEDNGGEAGVRAALDHGHFGRNELSPRRNNGCATKTKKETKQSRWRR
jgi:hypothetical protein